MAAWLLTWNPERWRDWDTYDEDCEEASKNHNLEFIWSCANRHARIGDEFFLMKQGKLPRGIIAHGIITQENCEGEHWDDDRAEKRINYILGECDTLLNYKTQEILDVSVLDERLPQQEWHPQSSGILIKDEVLSVLRELWAGVTHYNNPEESVYYEESLGIIEGAKKLVYTARYERDPKVRREFLKGKHLRCEVCGFDFEEVYGELGEGFIEVHHKKPVSEGERIIDWDNLNDNLVMLCSNCHRMIHRGKARMITVEELKCIIESNHRRRNDHVPDTNTERNNN
jgi:5-methylcytosine-specific restriction protein A